MSTRMKADSVSDKARLEALALVGQALMKSEKKQAVPGTTKEPEVSCPDVIWLKRDANGVPLPTGKKPRRRISSKVVTSRSTATASASTSVSSPSPCLGYREPDFNLQRLEELIQESGGIDVQDGVDQSTWTHRQTEAHFSWQQAREHNVDNLLSAERIVKMVCQHCHLKEAVLRCGDCMPSEWFCVECDSLVHKHHILHNRQTTIFGYYKYIPPTESVKLIDGKYTICKQDCLLPTAYPANICTCDTFNVAVSPGRPIILVCINGRYDLHVPVLSCNQCSKQWSPEAGDFIRSGYWPGTIHEQKTLFHRDIFESFEAMKTSAPAMSRQAFTTLLDQRTVHFGRTGKVNADSFQRSFLQYTYCNSVENELLGKELFVCPACSPEMVAVSVDGNRKLYRFQKANQSEDPGFFDGLFLAKDSDVSTFVEEVRGVVKSTAGKAMCGDSHWRAARESSKQANKLDEEGVEIAVCRHGFLLKALNMYRGEIFAYPMFLQKEYQRATYLAMDVTCRYVPYLEKVSEKLSHLQPLQQQKHCLSVMHAKAHNTKCEIKWNARNQEGIGTTLGEEVEQVNSFLSRCALTTKYMTKSARTDMLTVHAMGWNLRKENSLHTALSSRYKKTLETTLEVAATLKKLQEQFHCTDDMLRQWVLDVQQWAKTESAATSAVDVHALQLNIESLFVSVCQKKHYIYRQNDRNKSRQKISQKIGQEKKRLLEELERYNKHAAASPVDISSVVQNLSTHAAQSMIWPWQEQNADGVDILTKKLVFDQRMLLSRLAEEKLIIRKEMMQHLAFLKFSLSKVQAQIDTISTSTQTRNFPNGLSEEGSQGLICLLKRRFEDNTRQQQIAATAYKAILGPSQRLLEEDVEMENWREHSSDEDEDEDEGVL